MTTSNVIAHPINEIVKHQLKVEPEAVFIISTRIIHININAYERGQ